MVIKTNQLMMYNAKGAPCRIFECKTWWNVKKLLDFKRLNKYCHLSLAVDEGNVKIFNCAKNKLGNMCCNMEV